MTKILGICEVGRHINSVGYVILQFKSDGKEFPTFSMIEPIIKLSNETMAKSGLYAVSEIARNARDSAIKPLNCFTESIKKEMAKIRRDYALVSVEFLQNDIEQVKVIPLHVGRGGRTERRSEEICVFKMPKTNEEFMKYLNAAFDLAS